MVTGNVDFTECEGDGKFGMGGIARIFQCFVRKFEGIVLLASSLFLLVLYGKKSLCCYLENKGIRSYV